MTVIVTPEQKKFWADWIAAMRSGNYTQTTEYLRTIDGFCCLGVACDLKKNVGEWKEDSEVLEFRLIDPAEDEDNTVWDSEPDWGYWYSWTGFNGEVAHPVNESPKPFMNICVELNDDERWTFEQIADWVEKIAKEQGILE